MLRLWSWAAGFTSPWDSSDVKTRFEDRTVLGSPADAPSHADALLEGTACT
jgi:hypothetical protein